MRVETSLDLMAPRISEGWFNRRQTELLTCFTGCLQDQL